MAGLVEEGSRIGVVGVGAGTVHPVLSHHAIARRGGHGPELLRVALPSGEEVLPLFSSEDAAQDFLISRGPAGGGAWYARECCAGELVSLLLGLYAGIDGVLLDPVGGDVAEAPENLMRWKSFVRYLLGEDSALPVPPVSEGLAHAAGAR